MNGSGMKEGEADKGDGRMAVTMTLSMTVPCVQGRKAAPVYY